MMIAIIPSGKLGLNYLEKDYLYQESINDINNIIVLAGSENLEATEISKKLNLNDNAERLIFVVKLANTYPDSKIYFVGGDGRLKKTDVNEIYVAKLFFKSIGFDLNRIHFIGDTRNTFENIESISKLIPSNQSNVLITSAFHMKRTEIISRKFNFKFKPYAVDFKSVGNFSIINYYQKFNIAENLRLFNIFFREIIGILTIKMFV